MKKIILMSLLVVSVSFASNLSVKNENTICKLSIEENTKLHKRFKMITKLNDLDKEIRIMEQLVTNYIDISSECSNPKTVRHSDKEFKEYSGILKKAKQIRELRAEVKRKGL